jgi:L-alanine-DL-glutamate epimerase-like enolase superfamily enzyme
VLLADGSAGFGFTLNEDAGVARDMAAWDALGKSKGVPFYALMGGTHRRSVNVAKDELPALRADWASVRKDILENRHDVLRIDPFAWGSLEMVLTIASSAAAFDLGIALLAPNAHPWEIQYCAALAATMKGEDTRIILRVEFQNKSLNVEDKPGLAIDWSVEPAFDSIQWRSSTA